MNKSKFLFNAFRYLLVFLFDHLADSIPVFYSDCWSFIIDRCNLRACELTFTHFCYVFNYDSISEKIAKLLFDIIIRHFS